MSHGQLSYQPKCPKAFQGQTARSRLAPVGSPYQGLQRQDTAIPEANMTKPLPEKQSPQQIHAPDIRERKKHIKKKNRKQNFHGIVPRFLGEFCLCDFLPIRNDPKNT